MLCLTPYTSLRILDSHPTPYNLPTHLPFLHTLHSLTPSLHLPPHNLHSTPLSCYTPYTSLHPSHTSLITPCLPYSSLPPLLHSCLTTPYIPFLYVKFPFLHANLLLRSRNNENERGRDIMQAPLAGIARGCGIFQHSLTNSITKALNLHNNYFYHTLLDYSK